MVTIYPVAGGYVGLDVGDYSLTTKVGGTTYLYTYVNTPLGSVVSDYGPRDNIVPAGNFSFSVSSPKSAGFSLIESVKTRYALDAGGPGSSYVNIRTSKYVPVYGDYPSTAPETLNITHGVEYTRSTATYSGGITFTGFNTIGNHSAGFTVQ